ncbi:MAG: ROK family protein [Ruminococcaceae bacterium]|nr:ROK family protein [Oscillospiraceae bacterium]
MGKRYLIGVDLGGTNIRVGIFREDNSILNVDSKKTNAFGRSSKEIISDISDMVLSVIEKTGVSKSDIQSVGIGAPGLIDGRTGVVKFSGNLDWADVAVVSDLEEKISMPVKLANDADCAVLAEAIAGAGKGYRNVCMLTLGTGIGGGLVSDGELLKSGPGSMELGHMVISICGKECTCGARGCFEAYASATALIRDAKAAATNDETSLLWRLCEGKIDNMNGEVPFVAAHKGDEVAKILIDSYISYLGTGIVNVINIFRPDIILLGGGISNQGDYLIEPLTRYVRKRVFAGERSYIAEIKKASLGDDAGLLGAALL